MFTAIDQAFIVDAKDIFFTSVPLVATFLLKEAKDIFFTNVVLRTIRVEIFESLT